MTHPTPSRFVGAGFLPTAPPWERMVAGWVQPTCTLPIERHRVWPEGEVM
jgi:hypothetical protein